MPGIASTMPGMSVSAGPAAVRDLDRLADRPLWRTGWRELGPARDQVLFTIAAAGSLWLLIQVTAQIGLDALVVDPVPCARTVFGIQQTTLCTPLADVSAAFGAGFVLWLLLGSLYWAVALAAVARARGRVLTGSSRRILGTVMAIALSTTVVVVLGAAAGLVPGLVIAYLLQFWAALSLTTDRTLVEAARDSVRFAVGRPLVVGGFTLVALSAYTVGLLAFGIGIWAATALVAAAQVELVQRLSVSSAGAVGGQPEQRPREG